MKPLIIANWKCNPSNLKEAKVLFEVVKRGIRNTNNIEVIICPPFVYLSLLKGMALGAQNIFWEEKGAFTGEISAVMLKDLKVEYVIIGHSERRKYFGEADVIVNKKIKIALEVGLKIIFCVGENIGENKSMILEKQITEGLKSISRNDIKNVIIAYEPLWAIGTGKNCLPDEAISSALSIKKIISQLYSREIADDIKIIYGGSVNSKNSASYINDAGYDGVLVGGASLDAKEFIEITQSITH